jgi:hypothetical protein
VYEGKKIRFQISDVIAKSAGLKISAKLLSLASTRRASSAGSPTSSRRNQAMDFGVVELVQPSIRIKPARLFGSPPVRANFWIVKTTVPELVAAWGQLRLCHADTNAA